MLLEQEKQGEIIYINFFFNLSINYHKWHIYRLIFSASKTQENNSILFLNLL